MICALIVTALPGQDSFSKTWSSVEDAIRTRYYARSQRGQQMDTILRKYGPLAKVASSRQAFEQTVNQMIREFGDSHFAFLTDADQGYYLMDDLAKGDRSGEMPEIGAWFSKSADGYTVQMVLDGSAAKQAGLRKGDLITRVGDAPFSPIVALKPLVGSDAKLTFQRAGKSTEATVHVSKERALDMFLDASKESASTYSRSGHKYGYFHLWTQASEPFKQALANAALGKLRDTEGFILDLRDGFGGRPEGYADPFFRPPVWLEWKASPTQGYKELFGYAKPLVVLTNGGSRSAKEVLSFILQTSHKAVIVGQRTAGNVLGTFPQRMNDWSYLEIPIVDVLVDGTRLEGRGVSPDVPVPNEYDANGKDLDIEAALKVLTKGRPR